MEGEEGLQTIAHDVAQCVFAVHKGDLNAANDIRRRYEVDEFLNALAMFAISTLDRFAAARGTRSDAMLAKFMEDPDLDSLVRDAIGFVLATQKQDVDAARDARANHGDDAVFVLSVAAFAKNTFKYWAMTQGDSADAAWTNFLKAEPRGAPDTPGRKLP